MTRDQAAQAVPELNTYAHGVLGLTLADVQVAAGGRRDGTWCLIVATLADTRAVESAEDARAIIDAIAGTST